MTSISSYSDAEELAKSRPHARMEAESVWDTIPRQMPAATGDDVLLHGDFPKQDQVRIIISQQALLAVDNHAHLDLEREVGGALLGRVVRHQAQTFVEILAAIPAETADHGPLHFTFTADTWAAINRTREANYSALDVVGWFHTHPDLGVFYSSDDVVVHSAAFTLPWQVGLVVDPIRQEACFFGWQPTNRGKEIKPVAGYYEWLDLEPDSVITWDVFQNAHWAAPMAGGNNVHLSHNPAPALPPISPWWGVALGALSLLISLGLLIERLFLSG